MILMTKQKPRGRAPSATKDRARIDSLENAWNRAYCEASSPYGVP